MPYLRPDSKSQVTIEYGPEGIMQRIDTIVVSTQHSPDVDQAKIKEDIWKNVVLEVIPNNLLDEKTNFT